MKYKLYIRQYDITTNDYKVREEIVETNDIYHEIGKIYSTAFTEIKRIDYEKIDETKELKEEIINLNNIKRQMKITFKEQRGEIERLNNIINELFEYLKDNSKQPELFESDRYYEDVLDKLQELLGSDKE